LVNGGTTLELKKEGEGSTFIYPKSKENISFEMLSGNCEIIQANPNKNSIGKNNNLCNSITIIPVSTQENTPVPQLIINKICPNPKGGFEFLEIKNTSNTKANITNWIIKDSKGSEVLPEIEILPQKSFTFYPEKITLNNDGESISISNSNNTYANSITYPKAKENQCFTPDSLKTVIKDITIKADTSSSGPLVSIKKSNSSNTQGKTGYKILLKIPKLFRIQFGF
jgi:hypothetical protein